MNPDLINMRDTSVENAPLRVQTRRRRNNAGNTSNGTDHNSLSSSADADNDIKPQYPDGSNDLPTRDMFLATRTIFLTETSIQPRADDICSICLEGFEKTGGKTGLFLIPCKHIFHAQCACDWFNSGERRQDSCPNCLHRLFDAPVRQTADVTAEDEEYARFLQAEEYEGFLQDRRAQRDLPPMEYLSPALRIFYGLPRDRTAPRQRQVSGGTPYNFMADQAQWPSLHETARSRTPNGAMLRHAAPRHMRRAAYFNEYSRGRHYSIMGQASSQTPHAHPASPEQPLYFRAISTIESGGFHDIGLQPVPFQSTYPASRVQVSPTTPPPEEDAHIVPRYQAGRPSCSPPRGDEADVNPGAV